MHSGSVKLAHPRTGELFDSPVPPGSGLARRSGDAAAPRSPTTPRRSPSMADAAAAVEQLDAEVSVCRACPRLVEWREEVAVDKRKSFADQPYWGRPIPGWGSARPRVLIVGSGARRARRQPHRPGVHRRPVGRLPVRGAAPRRTGQPAGCVDAADGLALNDTRVVAAVRCAPPGNAPTPAERATCAPWLDAEWRLIGSDVRVIVALGGFAWRAALQMVRAAGGAVARPAPKFGHGATASCRRRSATSR